MKNLKKVLALVTMLTMLLSVAVSAGTLYPDVDDNASYAQAVETLNALEIMIGDEKGNFNPDASITRAEAAAIVVRLKAQGDLAAAGATAFTDVPADHWAAGYVNFAQQSGIINGYGDGTFGPSDPVTYEQIIKMIVAALGRTPQAEALGGYPSGYLMVASQEKINKGVSVTVGAEAPRSAVARVAYNALEVEMYGQLSYSNTGEAEFGPSGETLLADYLKVEKVEGIVDATVMTSGTPEDDAFVKIDGVSYLVGDTNAISLLGYAVEAYVAEDEETGDDIIKGITKKSFNSELVLDESLFRDLVTETEGEGEAEKTTSLVIEYVEKATDTDKKEAEILGAKRFFNGKADKGEIATFLGALDADAADFGTLTLINNDRDEAYEYIMLTQATDTDMVTAVDLDNLTIETKGGVGADIDVEDETEFTMFFKADGTVAELADIKEDDVLTVYANGNLKMIYISDAKAEGKVTEVSALKKYGEKVDYEYAIGTEKYRAAYINDEFVKVTAGQEGTFYLDVNGKIAFVDASKVTGNYAYLYTAAEIADINGAAVQMKVLTNEGNWEVLTTATKVNGNLVFAADGSEVNVEGLFKTASKKVTTITPGIFQYKLDKNGYVNQIVIPDATVESDKSYRANDQRIGAVYFTDDTLVFSLPEGEIKDEDDIKLVKATSLFTEGTEYTISAYDLDEDTNVPAIVVTKGATPDILGGTNLLVITKTAETTDEDDQPMTKVYGYQNGVEVEGAFYDAECKITAPEGHVLGAGDVVIFSLDADDNINKLEVLMSNKKAADLMGTGIGNKAEVAPDGEAYEAYGFVYKKDGNRVFLSADAKGKTALVDEEGTVLSLSLVGDNFTVYEVNLDSDVIKTSSVGKIKANVTREGADANWVYVRMYDGAVVDVVVYTQAVVAAK